MFGLARTRHGRRGQARIDGTMTGLKWSGRRSRQAGLVVLGPWHGSLKQVWRGWQILGQDRPVPAGLAWIVWKVGHGRSRRPNWHGSTGMERLGRELLGLVGTDGARLWRGRCGALWYGGFCSGRGTAGFDLAWRREASTDAAGSAGKGHGQ